MRFGKSLINFSSRCPEQVDTFLRKVRPLLEGTSGDTPDIDL